MWNCDVPLSFQWHGNQGSSCFEVLDLAQRQQSSAAVYSWCVCWEKPRERAGRGPCRAPGTERSGQIWSPHRRSHTGERRLCGSDHDQGSKSRAGQESGHRTLRTFHALQPQSTHPMILPGSCRLWGNLGHAVASGACIPESNSHRQLMFSWSRVLHWAVRLGSHQPTFRQHSHSCLLMALCF